MPASRPGAEKTLDSSRSKAGYSEVQVYRPDNRFKDKTWDALGHLANEIWRHRSHVTLLFWRDFKSAYHGQVLGVFWNFVLPLLPVSVYIFLSVFGIVPGIDGIPRAVYVAFNVTLWLLFAGLVEQPISTIATRNAEAMRTSLPISVTVASSFARLVFETLLRAGLVAALALAYLTPISPLAPLALVVIALGAAFSLAVGLLLAIGNIVVPDIQSIVLVVMRYAIFVSGVIFPLSAIETLSWLEIVNPFAILIHAARDCVFLGTITHPWPLVGVAVATIALAFFSVRVLYLMEYRIRGVV